MSRNILVLDTVQFVPCPCFAAGGGTRPVHEGEGVLQPLGGVRRDSLFDQAPDEGVEGDIVPLRVLS